MDGFEKQQRNRLCGMKELRGFSGKNSLCGLCVMLHLATADRDCPRPTTTRVGAEERVGAWPSYGQRSPDYGLRTRKRSREPQAISIKNVVMEPTSEKPMSGSVCLTVDSRRVDG